MKQSRNTISDWLNKYRDPKIDKQVEKELEEIITKHQREMTQEELADKILARYEDDREYHFHQVDREWIIEAMIEFAITFNTKER